MISVIIFFIVVLPIVFCIKGTLDDVFFKDTCVLVEGTITRIKFREHSDDDGVWITYYELKVEFSTLEGQTIQSKFTESDLPTKQVGDKVKIYYLPSNPSRFLVDKTIDSDDIDYWLAVKLVFLAIHLLAMYNMTHAPKIPPSE